jgi:hypothetical protein
MLEIADRTGEVWAGKFQVAVTNGDQPYIHSWTEQRSGELSFSLDTRTAEITFRPVVVKGDESPAGALERFSTGIGLE